MSIAFIAEPEDILYSNLFYPKQIESTCSPRNGVFLYTEDTDTIGTRSTSKIVTHTLSYHWETKLSGQMLQIFIPFNVLHLQNKTLASFYYC